MKINIPKLTDDIVKLAKGLGYETRLYDEFGAGPISSAKEASFIYLEPDGIEISMPPEGSNGDKDIFIHIGKNLRDNNKFADFRKRVSIMANMNGIGVSVKTEFHLDRVEANHLSDVAKANQEEKNKEDNF